MTHDFPYPITTEPPGAMCLVVDWVDTTNMASWSTTDEVKDFAINEVWKTRNVGWLVYEDEDCVCLAGRRTENGEHWGLTERIPRQAITGIQEAL